MNHNEDKRTKQIRFEFKWITIPYLIFAIIILLLNIFYKYKNHNDTIWIVLCL